MTEKSTWLSVIICTYRGERFLRQTLESIASQNMNGCEIIAVDDGSDDATPDILKSFQSRLNLRLIQREHSGNWVANTNIGLKEASGQYICLLHQDDLWLPGRIETMRRLTTENPSAGFLVNPSIFIDEDGRRIGQLTPPLPKHGNPLPSHTILKHLIVQNLFSIPAPLFRRDIAQAVGPMPEDLWFLADWHHWGQLAAHTTTIYHPQPLTAFRIHPQSQTSTRTNDPDDLRTQYHTVINSMLRELDKDSTEIQQALRSAYYNTEVSLALAAYSHGNRSLLRSVLRQGLHMSPAAWHRFLRDSRIIERLLPRLKVNRRKSRTSPKKS
jgi:glycosyltransferase involved in cell wall biosynthesis